MRPIVIVVLVMFVPAARSFLDLIFVELIEQVSRCHDFQSSEYHHFRLTGSKDR